MAMSKTITELPISLSPVKPEHKLNIDENSISFSSLEQKIHFEKYLT